MFLNLDELTLEQKIGQLICARGFCNDKDKEFILDMVKKRAVGGIQMSFHGDYKEFVHKVIETADYPILVCADMENGYPAGKFKFPYPMGIASSGDFDFAYNLGRVTAIEAKKDGVNVAWGPVLDMAVKGAVCKIGRCFGDDPEYVAKFAGAMIKGFQDEGMIVTAKHFPDGSDVKCDTHMQIGASQYTEEELIEKDIKPYIEIMKNMDLSGIMTIHKIFEKIDPDYPATLSPKVLGIIRNLGFDGIIMSDSLAMMAIVQNYGEDKCLGLSIKAGCDMVLPNYRLTYKESFDYLMQAYEDGVITDERLNEAVRRVLEAQVKASKPASLSEVPKELENIVEEAKKKSIIFIGNEDGVTSKIDENSKKLFVMFHENSYQDVGISRELQDGYLYSKENVLKKKEKFLEAFPGSEVVLINEFPNQSEIEKVCNLISKADETVFYIFCKTTSYLGSDSITQRAESLIKANLDKASAIIHVGNPYELEKYKGAKRIITTTYGTDCDEYIIKALKGIFTPCGKLTVDVL
ncbi:MAG: glycoside hydrolase family 3 protein [Clostridia bacterium]|nr:glycoside hydrolase family 3 protein [Clostridia bacterium]